MVPVSTLLGPPLTDEMKLVVAGFVVPLPVIGAVGAVTVLALWITVVVRLSAGKQCPVCPCQRLVVVLCHLVVYIRPNYLNVGPGKQKEELTFIIYCVERLT